SVRSLDRRMAEFRATLLPVAPSPGRHRQIAHAKGRATSETKRLPGRVHKPSAATAVPKSARDGERRVFRNPPRGPDGVRGAIRRKPREPHKAGLSYGWNST